MLKLVGYTWFYIQKSHLAWDRIIMHLEEYIIFANVVTHNLLLTSLLISKKNSKVEVSGYAYKIYLTNVIDTVKA